MEELAGNPTRTSRELLLATLPFAKEKRWLSWWHLWSTLFLLTMLTCFNISDHGWMFRLLGGLLAGLTVVRLFVLYHDHQHGAILGKSLIAQFVMAGFGIFFLNPASVWRRSHQHHHMHNCRNTGPNVGSFPLMTVNDFRSATKWERWAYMVQRHPLTIAGAYFSVFLFQMCLVPLFANPRRHFDAIFSIAGHGSLLFCIGLDGLDDLWLAAIVPCMLASAVGAYLFYAQHNYPGVRLRMGANWNSVGAALHSSSYIPMSPLLRWFTANIGFHHVHHLNSRIPFYRLPEAMAALPELQSPGTTSFHVDDIRACLRLKLWDPECDDLVPWPVRDSA